MDKLENRQNLIRNARKLMLQNRARGKKKRKEIETLFGQSIQFLDMEHSLALHYELDCRQISNPTKRFGFRNESIENDFELILSELAKALETKIGTSLFVFSYDWKMTGVAILSAKELARELSAFMYYSNDLISIYNSELTKALILDGDRTGTGDNLNQLEISILGQEWITAFSV